MSDVLGLGAIAGMVKDLGKTIDGLTEALKNAIKAPGDVRRQLNQSAEVAALRRLFQQAALAPHNAKIPLRSALADYLTSPEPTNWSKVQEAIESSAKIFGQLEQTITSHSMLMVEQPVRDLLRFSEDRQRLINKLQSLPPIHGFEHLEEFRKLVDAHDAMVARLDELIAVLAGVVRQ